MLGLAILLHVYIIITQINVIIGEVAVRFGPRFDRSGNGRRGNRFILPFFLPFVDRFLPGHNLRSLEELATMLAGIERRHAA